MSQHLPAPSAADAFARLALAPATLRAYRADWRHFRDWCEGAGRTPLPADPATVADYIAATGPTSARASVKRRLCTIGQAHKAAGLSWDGSHPLIRNTLRGVWRAHGRPQVQAAPLGLRETRRLLEACPAGLAGLRDRALFLISFAGALRRSEAAAIEAHDCAIGPDGLRLFLPRHKGDQAGAGTVLQIPRGSSPETCPVEALARWLRAIEPAGPVFRAIRNDGTVSDRGLDPHSVGRILQRRARAAGIEAGPRERLSAHGLRAGCITALYAAGLRDLDIMRHARHRDVRTTLGYVRRAEGMGEAPAGKLGL